MAKQAETQRIAARAPRQDRARHKVELILEAAMRLLDKGGFDLLTTNAVAETAGVSIGTLYQYFPNKEAILDALAERETAALSQRVVAVIAEPGDLPARAQIGRIVRAVTASYGERRQVHRLIVERSLAQGALRTSQLMERLTGLLGSGERQLGDQTAPPMTRAEAFVLTNAFLGVMRAMILRPEGTEPTEAEIEDALAGLVLGFVGGREGGEHDFPSR